MYTLKNKFLLIFRRVPTVFWAFLACFLFPTNAHADIVDSFDLAPFVPLVLESMMTIATSLYNYFVGNGTGLLYLLIYGFLIFSLSLYLVKMHLPSDWLKFLGFSGGGEMFSGKETGWTIAGNVLQPCLRAIIAGLVLLQIKPVYVTEWLVNPFLEFGSIYTQEIFHTINGSSFESIDAPICPESITREKWISTRSCDFLIKPVYIISKENNHIIKYGFDFIKSGLRSLLSLFPHAMDGILNIITGGLLVSAFVSANLFMALLIIQAIFDFCIALILYPFSVLTWVAKKSDKWFDFLPVFDQIIDALKKLVITMIACAFILCVNLAIVRSLFNWSSSIFVATANGMARTNVPAITNTAMNFGQHSILWLSAILTFFLMRNIFKMTRERLDLYTGNPKHTLYDNVTDNAKTAWGKVKSLPETLKNIWKTKEKLSK